MVTMADVAKRARVSVATVSFVVNRTRQISPETRARVERAIEDLGFRRNVVARALASQQTHILALAMPMMSGNIGGTPLELGITAAAEARARDYHLVLWPVASDGAELADLVSQSLVDGVLLIEVLLDDPRIRILQERQMPFAMIGRTADPTGLAYVDVDLDGTVEAALDRLQSLGHQRIAMLTGPLDTEQSLNYGPMVRGRRAYERLTRARGLDPILLSCQLSPPAGRQVARHLMEAYPEVTAVMVLNERAAVGLVTGLQRLGVAVPERVSVISLATTDHMAALSDPPLTILRHPVGALSARAVEMLVAQLKGGEPPASELLACTYAEGRTLAPALAQEHHIPIF